MALEIRAVLVPTARIDPFEPSPVRILDPLSSSPDDGDPTARDVRRQALERIPSGEFLLTASFGDYRGATLARWIQQVSSTPPMVMVAIEKGQPLSPIIRDARFFGLCEPRPEDRLLRKTFASERPDGDPFLALPLRVTGHGVPIPTRVASWLECELVRHLDIEGNCELYVGLVHSAGVHETPAPAPTAPLPGRVEHTAMPPASRTKRAAPGRPSKR